MGKWRRHWYRRASVYSCGSPLPNWRAALNSNESRDTDILIDTIDDLGVKVAFGLPDYGIQMTEGPLKHRLDAVHSSS
jgi:hypothetical protein